MSWQLIVVIVVVAAAAWYLVRSTWRTWRPKKNGCGGGCHCTSQDESKNGTSLIPVEQIRLRRKSGD